MPGSHGFCNAQNSNVLTRKCEHLFEYELLSSDETLIERYQDELSCLSLGCCPLTNASTGINECTIIPRHQDLIKTSEPLKYHMVSQKSLIVGTSLIHKH